MKAPAVAIDVHNTLTPELRERIIDDIAGAFRSPPIGCSRRNSCASLLGSTPTALPL
jgi:hypothetical protein